MQLYLQPELVDKENLSWEPGVVGNPTYGTYKKGEQLFEAAVNTLLEMIRDYHSGKLEGAFARRQKVSPDYKNTIHCDCILLNTDSEVS